MIPHPLIARAGNQGHAVTLQVNTMLIPQPAKQLSLDQRLHSQSGENVVSGIPRIEVHVSGRQ